MKLRYGLDNYDFKRLGAFELADLIKRVTGNTPSLPILVQTLSEYLELGIASSNG